MARYISIGYSVEFTADQESLEKIALGLMRSFHKSTGVPIEFSVNDGKSLEVIQQESRIELQVSNEMERQGKRWLDYYERAMTAEAELKKLREVKENA